MESINSTNSTNLIDKKGKINKVTFKQIIKEAVTSYILIRCGKTEINTTGNDLLLDLFTLDVPNDKDVEVHIIADNDYVCTGKDFNWFLKADRLSDLSNYVYGKDVFSVTDEEKAEAKAETLVRQTKIRSIKPVKLLDMSQHHVATVSTKDPENPIVNDFTGLKADCIKWLNQQIVQNATLENEVELLICLDYDAEEPDWKTLKELFNEQKIDIC